MSTATIEAEVVTDEPKQPLILKGSGYGLSISKSYQEQKAELLKASAQIVAINDTAADEAADAQIKRLAAMRIETEKARETVKRPALDFGKLVDTEAKTFVQEITAEEARLKNARGTYASAVLAERNRVLREAEEARQAQIKAEREAEEAKTLAEAAAEKARRDAEEAAFNAVSPEEEAEAARKAEEAAKLEAKRVAEEEAEAARKAALPVAAPTVVPEAPKGVKMVADYEVTDLDALYRHNVALVSMEPRRKEILDAIARGTVGDTLPTIPGLTIFTRPQVR